MAGRGQLTRRANTRVPDCQIDWLARKETCLFSNQIRRPPFARFKIEICQKEGEWKNREDRVVCCVRYLSGHGKVEKTARFPIGPREKTNWTHWKTTREILLTGGLIVMSGVLRVRRTTINKLVWGCLNLTAPLNGYSAILKLLQHLHNANDLGARADLWKAT